MTIQAPLPSFVHASTPLNLSDLEDEIIRRVCEHLPFHSRRTLAATCRSLRTHVMKYEKPLKRLAHTTLHLPLSLPLAFRTNVYDRKGLFLLPPSLFAHKEIRQLDSIFRLKLFPEMNVAHIYSNNMTEVVHKTLDFNHKIKTCSLSENCLYAYHSPNFFVIAGHDGALTVNLPDKTERSYKIQGISGRCDSLCFSPSADIVAFWKNSTKITSSNLNGAELTTKIIHVNNINHKSRLLLDPHGNVLESGVSTLTTPLKRTNLVYTSNLVLLGQFDTFNVPWDFVVLSKKPPTVAFIEAFSSLKIINLHTQNILYTADNFSQGLLAQAPNGVCIAAQTQHPFSIYLLQPDHDSYTLLGNIKGPEYSPKHLSWCSDGRIAIVDVLNHIHIWSVSKSQLEEHLKTIPGNPSLTPKTGQ